MVAKTLLESGSILLTEESDSLLLEEAAKMGARRIFVDGVAGVSGVLGTVGNLEARDVFHVLVEGLQR